MSKIINDYNMFKGTLKEVSNDNAAQQKSKTSYNTSQAFNSFAKRIAELSEKKESTLMIKN